MFGIYIFTFLHICKSSTVKGRGVKVLMSLNDPYSSGFLWIFLHCSICLVNSFRSIVH